MLDPSDRGDGRIKSSRIWSRPPHHELSASGLPRHRDTGLREAQTHQQSAPASLPEPHAPLGKAGASGSLPRAGVMAPLPTLPTAHTKPLFQPLLPAERWFLPLDLEVEADRESRHVAFQRPNSLGWREAGRPGTTLMQTKEGESHIKQVTLQLLFIVPLPEGHSDAKRSDQTSFCMVHKALKLSNTLSVLKFLQIRISINPS